MKRIMLFLLPIALFCALTPAANAQIWEPLMAKHQLRDAALSAADSLHISDWRLGGDGIDCGIENLDSLGVAVHVSDSAHLDLIAEIPNPLGGLDTVKVKEFEITAAGTYYASWQEIQTALFGGLGLLPREIDFHVRVHTDGTTYAGAPQATPAYFETWLIKWVTNW